jgi:ADP-ribosylglycohydrolase
MQSEFGYARQRFREAVSRLATGYGSVQERVNAAFHALDTAIKNDRVPGRLGEALRQSSNAWLNSGDGSIDAWAQGLSVDEAVEIATWLLQMSYEIEEAARSLDASDQPPLIAEPPGHLLT